MTPPTYQKEVCQFIGLVEYYLNMCARFSHTLASLTKMTSIKVKCKWTKIKLELFKEIKRILARNIY